MSIATQKSLALMKKNGWKPWIVERFIGKGKFGVRRDLYHIIDILGYDDKEKQFVGIQSTTMNQRKDHITKLLNDEREYVEFWLSTGSRLELWCWRKLKVKKKDGKFGKTERWTPKIDIITKEMLDESDEENKS